MASSQGGAGLWVPPNPEVEMLDVSSSDAFPPCKRVKRSHQYSRLHNKSHTYFFDNFLTFAHFWTCYHRTPYYLAAESQFCLLYIRIKYIHTLDIIFSWLSAVHFLASLITPKNSIFVNFHAIDFIFSPFYSF